jgi:hypothetical protein
MTEFQKLPGRIPWAAIRANNDAHLIKKSQRGKNVLDDPSRMGQKAIIDFLEHWHNRQEAGKSWPLKFLTPEHLPIKNQDSTSRQTQGTMGNHPRVGEDGGHISRNGDSDGVAGEEGMAQATAGGEEGMAQGTAGGGLNNAGDTIEVPMTPSQVEIPHRRLFLESLSKEAGYQKLIMLLDTADVSIVDFIVIELILTKPPAPR